MNYFKCVFASLLLLSLITACNAELIADAPLPTATIPAEIVSTPFPTETEPVSESTMSEPDLIAVKFNDPERVVPADLDPATQPQEVISQYLQTIGDGSNLWAGGSVQSSNIFTLEILSVSHDLPELISVTFPLYLKITKTTDSISISISISNSNILFPMGGGGGGGNTKFFSSISLQAGEFELMPDEPDPVILMKDVQQLFYFFDMPCIQTGVFDLQFVIPYSVTGNMVTQERTFEYTIQLACPESATLWLLSDPNTGQIKNGGRWFFQDAQYVPLP
jgi:hypothetical protein